MTIRTYVDANILITAFRGNDAGTDAAIRILGEPGRQFVSSPFLRLETLRKPLFYDRSDELDFMESYFAEVSEWICADDAQVQQALSLAGRYDPGGMDALHIAAAVTGNVDEFVTLEKPSKPMCQITEINVVSLYKEVGGE